MTKYIVWVKEKGGWAEQGDGPLTQKTAERIAKDVRQDCGTPTKVLPYGVKPDGKLAPKSIKDIVPDEVRRLENVAANAYGKNCGNGLHDWQSAEYAVNTELQEKHGFTADEAFEVGHETASPVCSAIDDGEHKCPCGKEYLHEKEHSL